MIIEIEYYKNDTFLYGKSVSFSVLKKQLETTENIYDTETDNFIDMFCRNYQWNVIENNILPDYIYDRDIKKLYKSR